MSRKQVMRSYQYDCDEPREVEDQVELGEHNKEVIEYWRKIW